MGGNKKKKRRASIKNPEDSSINPQAKTIAHALAAAIRAELPHLSKPSLTEEEREGKILSLDEEKTIQLSLENVKEHSEEDSESEEFIILSDSEEDESIEKSSSSTNEDDNFYICILDNLVSKRSSMHTEHAFCEENIKKNITFLLKYLNHKNNQAMTDKFLLIEDMKDLFKREKVTTTTGKKEITKSEVVSTKKLEKACLTEISNLWKVCASCNLAKSNMSIDDFLKENPLFGGQFVMDLKEQGGIRTGLLINTIYPQLKSDDAVVVEFGKETIALARANKLPKRTAIADFVKGWYLSHHRKAFEINKALQENHMKVNKQLLAGQRKKLEEGSSRSEIFVHRTAQAYGVAHAVYQKLDDNDKYSDSESDSGKEETDRQRNMYDVIAYTQHNSHYLKSIKRLLIKKGYSDIANKSKQLKKYLHNNTHIQLTVKDWKKIRKKIQQLLSDNKNEVTTTQFEDCLKALIEKESTISLSVEHNKLKTQLNQYEEELNQKKEELESTKTQLNQRKRELSQKDDKIAQLEKELLQLKRPSGSEGQFFTLSRPKVVRKRRPQSSQFDGNKANPKKPRHQ